MKKIALLLALLLSSPSHAEEFNRSEWLTLASQVCLIQAPKTPEIVALHMSQAQLNYNCRCLANDMVRILPLSERTQLMQQLRNQRNLEQTGKRMMNNPRIKQAAVSCSAAYWLS
ncbi:MAG: hypothetical protein WAU37_06425 [Formosimonas sp.]|jgi:predicted GTPase